MRTTLPRRDLRSTVEPSTAVQLMSSGLPTRERRLRSSSMRCCSSGGWGGGWGWLEEGAGGAGLVIECAGDLGEQGGDAAVGGEFLCECAGFFEEGVAIGGGGVGALHEEGEAGELDIGAAVFHGRVALELGEDIHGLCA